MIIGGVNKDGWWDEVKLMHQSEGVLNFLEAWDTDGEYQFVGHFNLNQFVARTGFKEKLKANALVSLNTKHSHMHTQHIHTYTQIHTQHIQMQMHTHHTHANAYKDIMHL